MDRVAIGAAEPGSALAYVRLFMLRSHNQKQRIIVIVYWLEY